jgi:hypothetical protein
MAKRQQSKTMQSKEMSGTRGRSNTNKASSKGSNNRRSAARVADNPDEQMQSAMPSDGMPRAKKSRAAASAKKSAPKAKSKMKSSSKARSAR